MKSKFSLIMAAAVMILASCSKTETIAVLQGDQIGFKGAYIGNSVQTRVQDNPQNITTASITEFIVYGGYDGTFTDVFNGAVVTGSQGGTWSYSPVKYWIEGQTYNFAAYAPALAQGVATVTADAANKAISFTDFKSDAQNQNDLLYAQPASITPEQPVAFSFGHALSKLRFTFKSAIPGDATITIKEFKFYGPNSQGDYSHNGTGMEWSNVDTPLTDADPFVNDEISGVTNANASGVATNDFLVVPQAVTGTVTFSVTITSGGVDLVTDKQFTATLPNTLVTDWVEGSCYNYTLEIKNEDLGPDEQLKPIEFTDPAVTDWAATTEAGSITLQ